MSQPIGISGSRSSAILGVSPYKTRVEIWLEMMESRDPGFCERNGYKYEKFEGNDQTAFGSAFENAICEIVGGVTDRERYYSDGNITCHIDGLKDGMLVENKTTSAQYFYSSFSEKLNRVPISYICQVQHNLYLTGLQKCMMNVLVFPKTVDQWVSDGWTVSFDETFKEYTLFKYDKDHVLQDFVLPKVWAKALADMGYLKTFIIERDDDLIKLMLDKYATFWNENIIGGKMPDVQTLDDIKSVYQDPFGTVIATEQVERWNAERKQLMQEKKDIDKRIEQLKVLEMEYLRSNDGLIDDETRDKTFLLDRQGRKLASYDGKVMR